MTGRIVRLPGVERRDRVIELSDRRRLDVPLHAVVVKEDLLVERRVQGAPRLVRRPLVELLRLVEQLQVGRQDLRADGQLLGRLAESAFSRSSFLLDLAQPSFDLLLRQVTLGSEVEQTLFLHLEPSQLGLELAVQLLHGGLLVGHGRFDLSAHHGDKIGRKCQRRVVLEDRVFNLRGRKVRQITDTVLPSSAEEVFVADATASLGFGVDHAGGAAVLAAAVAVQQPFQVVEQHPVSLAALRAGVHDFLDAVVQLLANDRLMSPGVGFALVDQQACVVRITHHAVQLGQGDRLGRPAPGRAGGEPEVGHGVVEPFQAVVARGVQLPGLADERCPFFVDGDGVDLSAFVVDADVAVADASSAVGAALFGLVLHLDLDVFARHTDLHFVDDVGDGFHGVGHDAFAEVFLGRDELDAHLLQPTLGDNGVTEIAEGARAHVDDDVVDFRVLGKVCQELPEDRPLLDGLR